MCLFSVKERDALSQSDLKSFIYKDDQDTGKWKLFFNHRLAQFGGKLVFWGNLSPKDVRLLNLRDPFLAEIMEYWTTPNYKDNNLDFTSAQIWHTSLIRIGNKPIFYKSWFTAGVKDVKDILDMDGKSIISYTAFTAKYKIKTNFEDITFERERQCGRVNLHNFTGCKVTKEEPPCLYKRCKA